MNELPLSNVTIADPFWSPRLLTNAQSAIYHQWEQLESTRCIDNFRLAASEKEGLREGWFFADSDAYKWLDAAARIQSTRPDAKLKQIMDDFIALLGRVQMQDGYIYTYNQIHFPAERWGNLMIEHELYCHGHLIEAGVSHFEATGETSALSIARKAADLLVRDFLVASPEKTSGHEEIEIALLRLYQLTNHFPYMQLASAFLERRGRAPLFPLLLLRQNDAVTQRSNYVKQERQAFLATHPQMPAFELPPNNYARKSRFGKWRWYANTLSGKHFQQHAPIRRQTVPVGHAVRFGYLQTATAMLARLNGDGSLLPAMEKSWDRLVNRRMYITGGLGALPEVEGFGQDYELDPELAYAETCAAIASLYWNWELTLLNGYAQYADLFEWQLYNAAAVGMGLHGDDYLYNNPLLCRSGIHRRPWFQVPCCPSNLSRTWASIGKYICAYSDQNIWVHQYIGSHVTHPEKDWSFTLKSGLPWVGQVEVTLDLPKPKEVTFNLRIPSWAASPVVKINGGMVPVPTNRPQPLSEPASSGIDPRLAYYLPIQRLWSPGDRIELEFDLPIVLRKAHPRVRGHRGKVSLTRGPLVYCLESVDNPSLDIFTAVIDPATMRAVPSPSLLGGIWTLTGKTVTGQDFTAIPYHLWANRGDSQMTVWMNVK